MNKEKIDYNKLVTNFNSNEIALKENNYFVHKKECEYKELKGMMDGTPIFTKFVEKFKLPFTPIILEETDEYIFVLNRNSPYEELDGKLACGMSFVHFFGIPKRRIYNSVSLKNEDIPLINNMKNKAIEYFDLHKNVLIGYIQKIIESKINKLSEDDKNKYESKIKNLLKKHIEIVNLSSGKDLGYYFHPHPYHSVGHLHLHIILEKTKTSNEHDWKNVPIEYILNLFR